MHACCLSDNEANEEGYDELRKAVKENWVTMKEYFKAVSLVIHYGSACIQQLSFFDEHVPLLCNILCFFLFLSKRYRTLFCGSTNYVHLFVVCRCIRKRGF